MNVSCLSIYHDATWCCRRRVLVLVLVLVGYLSVHLLQRSGLML